MLYLPLRRPRPLRSSEPAVLYAGIIFIITKLVLLENEA